mgnify:CR=1 FL=1
MKTKRRLDPIFRIILAIGGLVFAGCTTPGRQAAALAEANKPGIATGAVGLITTPELAASFDNGMQYFNTYGGNPVAGAVAGVFITEEATPDLRSWGLAAGLGGAFFFPTLGVGMEESLKHDVPALCAAFSAFNRWVDDDWGFAYKSRIYGAPYITLADPDWAVKELEWAISRGVRVVVMRTSPAPTTWGGTRSPGDEVFDPFWARAAEAGVVVAFHSGDAGYGKYIDDWEPTGDFKAFQFSPMRTLAGDRAPFDMFAVLVCHGVYTRHPNLKTASIEAGSDWVPTLVKKLKKAYAQNPWAFATDPVQQLRDHLWVAPFYEDDIRVLADTIGVDRVLFGSDYPHAEGLADPLAFVNDLPGFSESEVRSIMSDNALALLNG